MSRHDAQAAIHCPWAGIDLAQSWADSPQWGSLLAVICQQVLHSALTEETEGARPTASWKKGRVNIHKQAELASRSRADMVNCVLGQRQTLSGSPASQPRDPPGCATAVRVRPGRCPPHSPCRSLTCAPRTNGKAARCLQTALREWACAPAATPRHNAQSNSNLGCIATVGACAAPPEAGPTHLGASRP